MKIIGKTLEGDLIIQVSQAEWDGLQGRKPKVEWSQTEAYKLLLSGNVSCGVAVINAIGTAFIRGKIDGSIQTLHDIANRKIKVYGIGGDRRVKLKELLDEQRNEPRTTS